MGIEDISVKRSVLLSARMRFSPHTQPIKEIAIDKILEQNLLVGDCDQGLTVREMEQQGATCFPDGAPAISRTEVDRSIQRLLKANRLQETVSAHVARYRLDPSGMIHSVGALSSASLARPTFSIISSAVFRQTNGFGSLL